MKVALALEGLSQWFYSNIPFYFTVTSRILKNAEIADKATFGPELRIRSVLVFSQ